MAFENIGLLANKVFKGLIVFADRMVHDSHECQQALVDSERIDGG